MTIDPILWMFRGEDVWGLFQHMDSNGYYYGVSLRSDVGELYVGEGATPQKAFEIASHNRKIGKAKK